MIRIVFSLLLLILPYSELLRFQVIDNVYLRVLDILVLVLSTLLIYKNPQKLLQHKSLLMFLAILLISNLAHPLNMPALSYLIRTLVYWSLVPFFLQPDLKTTPKNTTLLHFGLLVFVLLGLVQYFYYPELRNLYYLGYDPHSYRFAGLFLDPNISSLLLVWTVLYFYQQKSKLAKPMIVLSLISLLFTYSRIGYLSLIVALIYQNAQAKQRNLVIGMIAVVFFGILLLPRYFGEGTNLFRVNSVFAKLESSRLVYQQLKNQPILGIGFNNVHLLKDSQNEPIANNSLYGIDNSWLTFLITAGLIGFGLLIKLIVNINSHLTKPQKVLGLAYLIHSLSVNSFLVPSLFIFFWIFILNQHKSPSSSSE